MYIINIALVAKILKRSNESIQKKSHNLGLQGIEKNDFMVLHFICTKTIFSHMATNFYRRSMLFILFN